VSESNLLMVGTVFATKIKWPEIFISPTQEVMYLCLSIITVIHAAYVLTTGTDMFA
jgi:hypothetical protein